MRSSCVSGPDLSLSIFPQKPPTLAQPALRIPLRTPAKARVSSAKPGQRTFQKQLRKSSNTNLNSRTKPTCRPRKLNPIMPGAPVATAGAAL